jgi:hypothetical protein
MNFPNDSSTQLDYTTVSIIPTYSINPTILFNDGTSGIYINTTKSIIGFTSSTVNHGSHPGYLARVARTREKGF